MPLWRQSWRYSDLAQARKYITHPTRQEMQSVCSLLQELVATVNLLATGRDATTVRAAQAGQGDNAMDYQSDAECTEDSDRDDDE